MMNIRHYIFSKRIEKLIFRNLEWHSYLVTIWFFYHSYFTWNQIWGFWRCKICHFNTFRGSELWFLWFFTLFKHEYLRSRASRCLSLSSFPPVTFSQFYGVSRYSCLHLGSRIQEFWFKRLKSIKFFVK